MSRCFLLAALVLSACSEDQPKYYTEASLEVVQGINVLRLVGTPFEMGLQHGELMADKLAEGVAWVENDPYGIAFLSLARSYGLLDDAMQYSYRDVYDECDGMTEAARRAGVDGWMDICVGLAYADVALAFIQQELPGCTQFVATGAATPDGRLLHGRTMDWGDIQYLFDHPTIIVRRPDGEIPSVSIGFPGCVAPYNGINAAGIAIAMNHNTAKDDSERRRGGHAHTQMAHQILSTCSSLDEVIAFFEDQTHCHAQGFTVSDGHNQRAGAFEITANHMGIREPDENGLVFMTNHFIHPDMADLHVPVTEEDSSFRRLRRLEQLLNPDGTDSIYGQVDAAGAVSVLRDTTDPITGETYPPDLFDGGRTIANNAAVWSMVFVPEDNIFYTAMGKAPVPPRTFVGFDIAELLKGPGAKPPDPPHYE
jgi:hypothetical protein